MNFPLLVDDVDLRPILTVFLLSQNEKDLETITSVSGPVHKQYEYTYSSSLYQ